MTGAELVTIERRLSLITRGHQALAEAKSVPEAKAIRDQAAAIEHYLKQQANAADAAMLAAELKLRAERKLGELLEKTVNHNGSRGVGSTVKPTLPKGVSKTQSHRWQRIASVPEDKFKNHVEKAMQDKDRMDLTTAAVLRIAKAQRRDGRREKNAKLETKTVVKLENLIAAHQKFATIYADPPWSYGNQVTRASTDNHYPTMTVDQIAVLPIAQLAADDARLHLWTTNAFLFECPRIFEAWGFEYKSSFIWCKEQLGIGNYWRNSHEFLLTAIRGNAKNFEDKSLKSWAVFPRGQHSAKPVEVRRFVERAGPGPRLELFGRETADGWTVWGNEVHRSMFDHDVPGG